MVDVFISYSRANQDAVRMLAKAVADLGYNIWWDDALPAHKSYSEVITEKIGEAKAAIVVWSPSAAESEWVRAEADVARNQKKLVQTSFDDDMLPPMPFNQIQVASLSGWEGEADHSGWSKIKASLLDLCGPPDTILPADQRPVYTIPDTPPPDAPIVRPDIDADAQNHNEPALPSSSLGLKIGVGVAALLMLVLAVIFWPRGDDEQDIVDSDQSGQIEDDSRFELHAVINDKDGWSNVRSGPSSNDAIVTRVVEGETFRTYEQQGDWWEVKLADGRTGYMYRTLIAIAPDEADKVEVETAAPPPPDRILDSLQYVSPRVIIPDSNTRAITNMEIADLDPLELRLARNEIYARKGYRFNNQRLLNWFEQFDWYTPRTENVSLNQIETRNVDRLKQAEANFR